MRRILSSLFAVALLLTAAPAFAQDASARFLSTPAPDGAVDEILTAVSENISMAQDDNGQPIPPLTEAQRATPLLDRETVREVMDIGAASGVGQACSLDWQQNNFIPLMNRERARGDRSQHQLAAIAMIHGLIQGVVSQRGACGPDAGPRVSAFWQLKWGAR